MESTKDYKMFKEFTSNREVDHKHVNKLIYSIQEKNLLHAHPIIVDRQMRVIDGQHRLAAAERLGVEIFYVVSDLDRKAISILNSNQKNWKALDYINFYTVEKVNSFVILSGMLNKYPEMSHSAILSLCSSEGRRNIAELKNGFIGVENVDIATEICDFCKDLFNRLGDKYKFVFDSRFPLALLKAFKDPKFAPNTLLTKIEAAPRAFVQCHTVKQYLEMIQEIYNRGLSKNAINLI
jgi:hypothetical protein